MLASSFAISSGSAKREIVSKFLLNLLAILHKVANVKK